MSPLNRPFSIVIPTAGVSVASDSLIERLVRQLVATPQQNFEIVVVLDINKKSEPTLSRLSNMQLPNLKIVPFYERFNFSKKCNLGAAAAQYEALLFLNDDVEISDVSSLQELTNLASEDGVGAVGCLLTYPTGEIQHAGIAFSSMKPKNAYSGLNLDAFYLGQTPYQVAAVTGACLAITAERFHQVGGWDEDLSNSYNDVDCCLSLLNLGYKNYVVPSVKLVHHEAQTRNENFDIRAFEKLWQKHAKHLGNEQFLKEPIVVNQSPTSNPISELTKLGLRGLFWAIYYRLSGRSKILLAPPKR